MSDEATAGPEPIPQDEAYWAAVEAETNYVPDGDDYFIDTRPAATIAPLPVAPAVLLPQVVSDGLVNLQAERMVLAALVQENGLLDGPIAALVPDDFTEPLHQALYAAIREIVDSGKAATPVTLWPRFAKDAALSDVGGVGYLVAMGAEIGAAGAAQGNAAHLQDLANRRRLAGVAQSVAQTLADPQSDIAAALAFMDDARKATASSGPALITTRMADLAGVEISPRQWVVKGWLPAHSVTFLAGPGGVGKSLLVQQWLTAISIGADWMGMETLAQVPTLYVTCEDESDEVARRNADIAQALRYPVQGFTNMHTISLAGAEGNEMGTFDAERRFRPSARFAAIVATAKALGARVVALDNVAHMYTGNENVRGEVTQFVNLLTRLALEIGGAVILLGHPAKAEGSEYSGSTAWENAVRSRLFLHRPDGENVDPNARILTRSKSNYAAKGEGCEMVWHHGAFVPPSEVPETARPQFEAAVIHNERFLECLDLCIQKGRAVSHNVKAGNYAPRIFADMPAARGLSQANFKAAMERLLELGTIRLDAPMGWRDNANRWVFGIGRTA